MIEKHRNANLFKGKYNPSKYTKGNKNANKTDWLSNFENNCFDKKCLKTCKSYLSLHSFYISDLANNNCKF